VVKPVFVLLLANAVLVPPTLAAGASLPWSREEGMRACLKNCISKIEKSSAAVKEQRAACKERCICIMDEMFESGGKPKRDQTDLAKVAAECKGRLQPKPASAPERLPPRPEAAPTPAPKPGAPTGADLLPGTNCTTARMPTLQYEPDEHRIVLAGGGFKMRLPKGWSAVLERPDLVVISAASVKGVRPVFEMFVNPVCKTYDGLFVNRRVAARGLAELQPAAAILAQVKKGSWTVGMGGRVGQNLVLNDVVLKTDKGDRIVVLYSTQLGESKNFGLHAAAVCPKQGPNEGKLNACETTYFDMLEKAEY
jgi:hypothetical protein